MTTVQTAPTIRGNSNVQKERTPVPSIVLSKNNERKRFAAILSATDVFLSQVVLAIEDVVDPHNERALQQFFAKMAKDNVMKNDLPKFAAGTGFSRTLNALNVLSVTATNACMPEMVKAAHSRQRSRTSVHPTATRTSVQPTSTPTSAQPTATPNVASTPTVTPTDASTPTAADALGLYLRAARAQLTATQKEVRRLEADNCTWRPKRFFAKRLREFERSFHARCVHFEGDTALALLPPFAPARRVHKRTHAEAVATDTTVSGGLSRMDTTETVEPSRQ